MEYKLRFETSRIVIEILDEYNEWLEVFSCHENEHALAMAKMAQLVAEECYV